MSEEYEAQTGDEGGMTGPGAPTPLAALEVSFTSHKRYATNLLMSGTNRELLA